MIYFTLTPFVNRLKIYCFLRCTIFFGTITIHKHHTVAIHIKVLYVFFLITCLGLVSCTLLNSFQWCGVGIQAWYACGIALGSHPDINGNGYLLISITVDENSCQNQFLWFWILSMVCWYRKCSGHFGSLDLWSSILFAAAVLTCGKLWCYKYSFLLISSGKCKVAKIPFAKIFSVSVGLPYLLK